ncbi:MAG TPA: TonB-dependent receptor [Flavobacterium sp.]|nr:TonB-dependent receptor [Flavobacterium sp.]
MKSFIRFFKISYSVYLPHLQKNNLCLLLLLASSFNLYAQHKVSGSVSDAGSQPLDHVPVVAMAESNGQSASYAVTDASGKFELEIRQPGNYYIQIEAMGFKKYKGPVFTIDASAANTALPAILLEKEASNLEEVVIVSKKPLFTQKTDRLVYNVANALASQGGSAIDALKNTPLIKVDETNNNIAMIGKSGLNVLVNNRPINLTGDALMAYLSTISSDNISKIEIITTPPAQYQAEGNSGLINIILKKNPNQGWNGNINTAATQRTFYSGRNNAILNFQNEKWSMTSGLLYGDYKTKAYETTDNTFDNGFVSSGRQDKIIQFKNFAPSVNLNYKVSSNTDLSLVYELNRSDLESDDTSDSQFAGNGVLLNSLLNKGFGKRSSTLNRIHGIVAAKLDTIGKTAEIGFQWLDNAIDDGRTNDIIEDNVSSKTNNVADNSYRLGVANLDFHLPVKKLTIETGLRYTFLDNASDVRFYDFIDGTPQINPLRTNKFNYKENIFAAYLSSEVNLSDKWSVQAGLRYEQTSYNGTSEGTAAFKRSYGNLFPTFYLNYKRSDDANYSFRYSKRVDRPRQAQLNPFQWFINPFSYVEGNPFLQPSFTDNFELTYSNNANLSLTLYHSITKDKVGYLASFLEEGKIQRLSYFNVLDAYQYGIFANYTFTKIRNLESQLSGSAYWQKTSSKDASLIPSTSGYGADLTLNNSLRVGKKEKDLVQLNYRHTFPSFDGVWTVEPFGFLSLGYRTSFFNESLAVGATASTILSKNGEIALAQARENASLRSTQEYDYQSFVLNITYKFGNAKVRGSSEKAKAEEAERIQ